ncbi:MAG: DUF2452 domain-containing protein [Gammaproteobacteria bacterium]|nr:DUF2452 domain-containing protein [Gammaproteobacteria bacterium]MCW8910599.1 DUF2452 domain-containing protein [Gammaproteobacteria bacterium]MCW9005480.1 DUF2452 domain-containing protein [Gammaproteobacteria bacterium]MCW9055308.1 DUF2452 domain-containing protein [Gammaproteobacteria bacterium]
MNKQPKKHTGSNHQGDDRTSPYPVSRLAPQVELVDLARQISEADAMVNTRVSAKLKVIADQIKSLQTEAKSVLEEARLDQDLHRAECNFKRIPGKIYHLYQKNNGNTYFSMLSPDDWGGSMPHKYIDSYRLENDMSWLPVDRLDEKDDSRELVNRLLLEKGL